MCARQGSRERTVPKGQGRQPSKVQREQRPGSAGVPPAHNAMPPWHGAHPGHQLPSHPRQLLALTLSHRMGTVYLPNVSPLFSYRSRTNLAPLTAWAAGAGVMCQRRPSRFPASPAAMHGKQMRPAVPAAQPHCSATPQPFPAGPTCVWDAAIAAKGAVAGGAGEGRITRRRKRPAAVLVFVGSRALQHTVQARDEATAEQRLAGASRAAFPSIGGKHGTPLARCPPTQPHTCHVGWVTDSPMTSVSPCSTEIEGRGQSQPTPLSNMHCRRSVKGLGTRPCPSAGALHTAAAQ